MSERKQSTKKWVVLTFAPALVAGLWSASAALAASPGDDCRGGPDRLPPPLAESDLNKDGSITRAEVDRAVHDRFSAADTNKNGTLEEKEFAAMPRPSAPLGLGPPPWASPDPSTMFKRIDWNMDARVTPEELAAPVRGMAMRADRNADGTISPDEQQRPR